MTASESSAETERSVLGFSQQGKTLSGISKPQTSTDESHYANKYLVVSPYTEQEHLLDLETLGPENQLLALALTGMKCLREDYATRPYLDIFNWDEIIGSLRALARERSHRWQETSFFVVAFRSQIPPTTVYADLGVLDKAAHVEATKSGGFLKYAQNIRSRCPGRPCSHLRQVLVWNTRLRRSKSRNLRLEIAGGCEKGRSRPSASKGGWGGQIAVLILAH